MGVQGLVTVKSKNTVFMKVVAGCNGLQARKVAAQLEKAWPVTVSDAYQIAQNEGLGCIDCLVVITDSEIERGGAGEINPRYYRTFQDERFNPRWENGTADITVIVSID